KVLEPRFTSPFKHRKHGLFGYILMINMTKEYPVNPVILSKIKLALCPCTSASSPPAQKPHLPENTASTIRQTA
ncbi:MAG: hypothetical protein AAB069_01290, partial [Planctomycetota bacterium]